MAGNIKASETPMAVDLLRHRDELQATWNRQDVLIIPGQRSTRYIAGFATSDFAVETVKRLRFQVFNLELSEGFQSSYATGLDEDRFDDQMTHLVLLDPQSHHICGTYRIQTATNGLKNNGIYSGQEFILDSMQPLFDRAAEIGRACVSEEHRNFGAIMQLWAGILYYLNIHQHYYLFGCCSITSNDPLDGWRTLRTIREKKYMHPELYMPAQPEFSCGHPSLENDPALGAALPLPKLFKAYMRLGACVISEPAIDREFGTVDFLVMQDARIINLSSLDTILKHDVGK